MDENIFAKYDTKGFFARLGRASEKLTGDDQKVIHEAMEDLARLYELESRLKREVEINSEQIRQLAIYYSEGWGENNDEKAFMAGYKARMNPGVFTNL